MKTRTSKIARLPKSIRDQLNHKIDDGTVGLDLVKWLNSLPEVQKIMAELFGGRAITPQNVSEWRRTGYADWQFSREGRQHWWELIEAGRELNQSLHPNEEADVSGYLETVMLVELSQALNQLGGMKNSKERWKLFRMLSLALSRHRNDDTREKFLHLKELKCSQILSNPAHSCQKNFFSQSPPPGTADPAIP